MRKLLLGSVILTVFSISILIFQVSCKKEAVAQTGSNSYTLPPATTTTLGGIIVGSGLTITNNGTLSATGNNGGLTQLNKVIYRKYSNGESAIWTANYDGSGQTKINIILPPGTAFASDMTPAMSPNGDKIFFTLSNSATSTYIEPSLYTANIDGSNLVKIVDSGVGGGITLGGVY